jgi:hypothetical protein
MTEARTLTVAQAKASGTSLAVGNRPTPQQAAAKRVTTQRTRDSAAGVVAVAVLVNDKPPVPARRRSSPEVLEVERQDRQVVTLRDCHHRRVGIPKVEIRKAGVDLDGPPPQCGRDTGHSMLAGGERPEEQSRGSASDPRPEELVDLDDHGFRDQQIATELGDDARRQRMRPIPTIGRRDERPGVGDDPQLESTRSRRYCSARRPSSSGPSPEPT